MRQGRLATHTFWLVVCFLLALSAYPAYGAKATLSWLNLADYTLAMPESSEVREYLGLDNVKSFSICEIPAKLILIGCFSLYCPSCHKQAPKANKLFELIQQDPHLSKDLKMIGICAGNNREETGVYKTTFRVPFPLFSDPDFVIHKKFGSPRTPFTVLATRSGDVLLIYYGVMKDVEEFVWTVKKFHKQQ